MTGTSAPAQAGRPAVVARARGSVRVLRRSPALLELVRFATIGVVVSLLDLVLANVLYLVLDWGPTTSKASATIVATALSYVANRAWSFGHRVDPAASQVRAVAVYALLNVLALGITLVPVDVAHYVLGLTSATAFNVSSILGNVASTAFRFWAYRRFVFTGRGADQPA